jgi:GNAT superfamily N-acetyltransferase
MKASVLKTDLGQILPLREHYLAEMSCQIRYNACHERGWSDSWLLLLDGNSVGYGSIKGREIEDRDTVFEFFLPEPYRASAGDLFHKLLAASSAEFIECQSNDRVLTNLLFEFSSKVTADVMLFADNVVTHHQFPGVVRPRRDDDLIFEHKTVPVGDYVLYVGGNVIASGGFLLHYNKPFADLHMEVREDCRGKGAGTFLLQEVKKACYAAGRVPAARCNLSNKASRATLLKAGLCQSGFMLAGPADRLLTV